MKRQFARSIFIIALALLFLPTGCQDADRDDGIRLVVLVVIDQLPEEYLSRFRPVFSHGFKRLLDEGAHFTEAYHDHAATETCPGHAAIATGTYPKHSGIISNWWFNRDRSFEFYCVDDPYYGRSPRNLMTSTIGDWLRNDHSKSKIFSASTKDRAAIMLGGKKADGVFWYHKLTGGFISSRYYPNPQPDWLIDFNAQDLLYEHFGHPWLPEQVAPALRDKVHIVELDEGAFPQRFPHILPPASVVPDPSFYDTLYNTPYMDSYLLEFAKKLVTAENLGKDGDVDLLTLSFSALDIIGHRYGPHSPEVLDTLVRLDKTLGDLLDYIDSSVGLDKTLFILTSDHGVQAMPEVTRLTGDPGHRQNAEDVACIQTAGKRLAEQFGSKSIFRGPLYLNHRVVSDGTIDSDELDRAVREELEACEMVERVWTDSDLFPEKEDATPMQKLFENSFYPNRSGDYVVQIKENYLSNLIRGTGHGTPYRYDSHVPVIFKGPGIPPGQIHDRIAVVDVAPTIARLMKLTVRDKIDGVDQSTLLRPLPVTEELSDNR